MVQFNFRLTDKKILITGGGPEAESILLSLLHHDPVFNVISPYATDNIKLFHRMKRITYEARWIEEKDITSEYYFIFAVTGDEELDKETAIFARKACVPVFVLGKPENSDFSFELDKIKNENDFELIKGMLKTKRG